MDKDLYSQSKIKRTLHIYFVLKIVNLLFAFLFQIAVAKILLPPDFATYAVLLATLMAGERALSFGIDRTVLRFVPALTRGNDAIRLRALLMRVGIIRTVGMIFFGLLFAFGAREMADFAPVHLTGQTLVAFSIWFISYTFAADADALAQSWMAHLASALTSMAEITIRIISLVILSHIKNAQVEDIVSICALTSAASTSLLMLFLVRRARIVLRRLPHVASPIEDTTFDPRHAPMFAFANFVSTLSYLISSPPVIRIIASSGLEVVTLAAFSFAQSLYISLQRAFPGLLIIPSIEPIVMSRLAGDVGGSKAYANMSLIYKAELVCILSVSIATTIAGPEIISILSRASYAPYYFVLPILIMSLMFITSYRLFELVANSNFRQDVFFRLWPLSVICMAAMYATIGNWGLAAVLFWPIAEIVVRIGILTFLLRRYSVWRAFDPPRSLMLVAFAGVTTATLVALRYGLLPLHFSHLNLIIAAGGVLLFLASFTVLRPLQLLEYEALVSATPSNWTLIHLAAYYITKRSG